MQYFCNNSSPIGTHIRTVIRHTTHSIDKKYLESLDKDEDTSLKEFSIQPSSYTCRRLFFTQLHTLLSKKEKRIQTPPAAHLKIF